jgi:hypothetical protein
LLCVQGRTPDDGQRNCPKHVEFNYENKFEKSVHLVGFIIRKYEYKLSYDRYVKFDVHGISFLYRKRTKNGEKLAKLFCSLGKEVLLSPVGVPRNP